MQASLQMNMDSRTRERKVDQVMTEVKKVPHLILNSILSYTCIKFSTNILVEYTLHVPCIYLNVNRKTD